MTTTPTRIPGDTFTDEDRKKLGAIKLGAGLTSGAIETLEHAESSLTALRAEVERLTAERDEARALLDDALHAADRFKAEADRAEAAIAETRKGSPGYKTADGRIITSFSSSPSPRVEVFDIDAYQARRVEASRVARIETERERLMLAALGLAGEAGEVVDIIKKVAFHGRTLDDHARANLVIEAGDVQWYLALLAHVLGMRLSDFALANEVKLAARYPNGFVPEGGGA